MAREKKEPVADGARSSVTQYVFKCSPSDESSNDAIASSHVSSAENFPRILMHTCAHTSRLVHCFRLIINVCRKERENIFFFLSPFDFKKEEPLGLSQTTMHDRFRSNVDASDGGFKSIEQRTIN